MWELSNDNHSDDEAHHELCNTLCVPVYHIRRSWGCHNESLNDCDNVTDILSGSEGHPKDFPDVNVIQNDINIDNHSMIHSE